MSPCVCTALSALLTLSARSEGPITGKRAGSSRSPSMVPPERHLPRFTVGQLSQDRRKEPVMPLRTGERSPLCLSEQEKRVHSSLPEQEKRVHSSLPGPLVLYQKRLSQPPGSLVLYQKRLSQPPRTIGLGSKEALPASQKGRKSHSSLLLVHPGTPWYTLVGPPTPPYMPSLHTVCR